MPLPGVIWISVSVARNETASAVDQDVGEDRQCVPPFDASSRAGGVPRTLLDGGIGGGGGNRTRVRKPYAVRTTCLAWLFELRLASANRQALARLAASTDPPGEAATPGGEADVNDAAPLAGPRPSAV